MNFDIYISLHPIDYTFIWLSLRHTYSTQTMPIITLGWKDSKNVIFAK